MLYTLKGKPYYFIRYESISFCIDFSSNEL